MKVIQNLALFLASVAAYTQLHAAIPRPPQENQPAYAPAYQWQAGPIAPVEKPTGRYSADTTSSNTPPDSWYNDIHHQLYTIQQSAYDLNAKNYSPEINYYTEWLTLLIDVYYASAYDNTGKPIDYSWGKPTRGDFNHFYYYWVRPVYSQILYYSKEYSQAWQPAYYEQYTAAIKPLYQSYHSLTRCNYGADGNDLSAEDDSDLESLETEVGLLK